MKNCRREQVKISENSRHSNEGEISNCPIQAQSFMIRSKTRHTSNTRHKKRKKEGKIFNNDLILSIEHIILIL